MFTDSFFQQGGTHAVCQDYSAHGDDYAIISDGCSSAPDSDFGARLIIKAAERELSIYRSGFTDTFVKGVIFEASAKALQIGNLNANCLTATLGLVVADKDKKQSRALLVGDGVIGAHERSGKWEVKTFEPTLGGCFYPTYMLKESDMAAYYQRFEGRYETKGYRGHLNEPEKMDRMWEDITLTTDQPYFCQTFNHDEYDFVFVGSDGLLSFMQKVVTETSKHNESIGIMQVLSVLFDQMYYRPNFLQIQRQWAFKRPMPGTFVKRDWHNTDDVSVAAISIGEQS
jgi:hypothetical protein